MTADAAGRTTSRRVAQTTRLAELAAATPRCAACGKPETVCVCDRIEPVASPVAILILQHPQEQDHLLGTAALVAAAVEAAEIRRGLSWPSLAAAVGRPVDRKRWAVLAAAKLPTGVPPPTAPVSLLRPDGRPATQGLETLEGIIVLDGTWSQAKALWWRNPWLTKLHRIHLVPREASMFGALRREPRREWVSTLEAVADVLPACGGTETDRTALRRVLRTLLQRVRDALD